jgi:hypothetical protein
MKLSFGKLRKLLTEIRIAAKRDYMAKERQREMIQRWIVQAISSGMIIDQRSLDEFIATIVMAATTLKSVPFDVWQKLAVDEKK